MILTLLLALTASLTFVSAETPMPEFQIVSKNQLRPLSLDGDLIIHETANDYILKSPLTNFASYDYYYLQLPSNPKDHQWFLENTRVITEKPGEFLIVEIGNEKQLLEVASQAHHKGNFCGMLQKLSAQPIVREKQSASQEVGPYRRAIAEATNEVNIDNIISTMETMVSWGTRFESNSEGVKTGEKLKALYEEMVPADRDDVEIELVDHRGSEQKSLVVRIKGHTEPEKVVILGSHIDSINQSDKANAPGADDNASGTATNMEVFRVLMANSYKPSRTLEIHGYAAEEIGLVGSKEMAEDYKQRNVNVISMVQFDMNAFAKNNAKITFVTNGTDSSLTSQMKSLAGMYNDIPNATGFLLFGSSDHAAWAGQGFPVAFPTEDPFGFNRKIHTKDDTMANINSPKQIEEFGKLGVAYFMDFGK